MRTWSLIRIVYKEALDRAGANPIPYSSYCLVPSAWRSLKREELELRVKHVLEAALAEINHQIAMTEDPEPFVFSDSDFEWVSEAELATKPWQNAHRMFYVDEAGQVRLANYLYNPYVYFEERLL